MNSFQRKSLYAALAGVGALGATTAAEAVNVNPNGLGQVLIYPYYTVRADGAGNAYNSLLTVVNSTDSVKAVKVRFLEGKNSREVIDFNLFLSAFDVWTGAVIPSPLTAGGRLVTFDKSCTLPPIATTQGGPGFVDFVNFAYTGSADDKGGTSLDRTKEGYVEIIEMATYTSSTTVAIAVTHAQGKVAGQPDCKPLSDPIAAFEPSSATGGLFGGMTLINVGSGTDYTEDAVALDNFNFGPIYNFAGVTTPDLTQAAPPISQVLANNAVYTSTWSAGPDPVSAVLMHDHVMNVFVLDAGTKSGTDWVVTFPTKRFYINTGTGLAPKLFQRNFNDGAGSCDDVSLNIYDREEKTTSQPITFSPPPPVQGNALCWEANIVTFNNSNVLGSVNVANIPTTFQNGWLNLGFFPTTVTGTVHKLINVTNTSITFINSGVSFNNTVTYFGLPVVGFEVESYTNGVNQLNVLSNFGGNFVHKTTTRIQ
jgi:hypothetical protein